MKLTPKQRERYSRMLALHDFDEEDMEALMSTTVSVVGAGGLGSPALRLLAAIGFGRIRIIDQDIVELSNIQRQTVYNTEDIGKPKAESAATNLARMNPEVDLEPISVHLDDSNAVEILRGSDVIVDGLDSFRTRNVVNRASQALGIPYVFAGAIEYHSNLSTFIPGETGCLYCLAGDAEDDPDYTCALVGVTPELLSIVAAVQVREALLIATGRKARLRDRLMMVDLNTLTFDFFEIGRNEKCPICSAPSKDSTSESSEGPTAAILCGGTIRIAPARMTLIDTKTIAKRVSSSYKVKESNRWLTVETPAGLKITLMARGNAIVKGTDSEEEALALYQEIMRD
ncbi:MAG: ThiF family adenylyltransferase [Promethearchaeota archaeon]